MQLHASTVYYDLDKILSAGSVPAFDTVSAWFGHGVCELTPFGVSLRPLGERTRGAADEGGRTDEATDPYNHLPQLPQVYMDASKAVAPPVAESKAPAPANTPFRTTSTLKPRPYYQPKTAQDSLDFDKILLDSQLPPRPPTSSKKRNVSLTVFGALALVIALTPRPQTPSFSAQLPESERSLSDHSHRRVSVHFDF